MKEAREQIFNKGREKVKNGDKEEQGRGIGLGKVLVWNSSERMGNLQVGRAETELLKDLNFHFGHFFRTFDCVKRTSSKLI